MLGLGKKRTRFGRWLDNQEDINQLELEKATKLSRPTISRLCNDRDY
ncbi:transcriptional regulator, partial [Priestia megaterium]